MCVTFQCTATNSFQQKNMLWKYKTHSDGQQNLQKLFDFLAPKDVTKIYFNQNSKNQMLTKAKHISSNNKN